MYNYQSAMYDRFAFQKGKINHDDILCGYSCWLVDPINYRHKIRFKLLFPLHQTSGADIALQTHHLYTRNFNQS